MKIGVSNLGCPDWTFEEAAARAKEYGYEGMEIRMLDGEVVRHRVVEIENGPHRVFARCRHSAHPLSFWPSEPPARGADYPVSVVRCQPTPPLGSP